jgi:hypothetical protein
MAESTDFDQYTFKKAISRTSSLRKIEMPRRSTTTRSFRVDELALEAIEKDAAKANVSVNTLVNQLLLSYANFDHYFGRFQTIKITSDAFADLIQYVPDECAVEAGRRKAGSIASSVILAKYGSLNLDGVLDHLKTISEYSKFFTYSESERGGRRAVILIHRFGPKGSIYFTEYLKSMFEMIGLKPKIISTEKAVNASF